MEKLKLTLIKSGIDRPEYQKRTLKALGLRKVYNSVEKTANPALLGMIDTVKHLLKIEKV